MRYMMRQKLFSFGDRYAIRNEAGHEMYFVEGEVFTLGNKLSFQDAHGNELLYIGQKLLSWGPTYELYRRREDDVLILASTVVIDLCCHGNID